MPLVLGVIIVWLTAPAFADQKEQSLANAFKVTFSVDITAKSAQDARLQALNQAPVIGLEKIFRRLVPKSAINDLPSVDSQRARSWVKDIEISHERMSTVRYAADITVGYTPVAIRNFLREAGQRFAETPSSPLLILPVLEQDNRYFLWDEPNPWFAAWAATPARDGLVTMLAPLGDAKDMEDISRNPNITQDPDRLLDIARRYHADKAIVAWLALNPPQADDRWKIKLQAWRIDSHVEAPQSIGFWLSDVPVQTDLNALFANQVEIVATAIEEAWKEANLNTIDDRLSYINLTVPVDSLDLWIDIQHRLRQMTFARYTEILVLEPQQVLLRIGFSGTSAQLERALKQEGLQLVPESDMWTLRLISAKPDLYP